MLTKLDAKLDAVNEENLGDLQGEFKARWIRVSVDMLEHDAFVGEPFSRRDAWLWLIANAAWKPRRFKVAKINGMIELQRGQTLAARGYLAHKWMWGEKKVRLFLEFLESENMIEMVQSKGRFANVVTICNYDKYQKPSDNKGQLEGRFAASSGPVEGQTLTKNTNTTNLELDSYQLADTGSVAARGPEEISGLNGSTGMIVEHFAHWLNPYVPDYTQAFKSVADACRIYGPVIVRDAFAELKADHRDGKVRALTHKAFYGYCRTLRDGRGKQSGNTAINAKQAAGQAELARLDAMIAESIQ